MPTARELLEQADALMRRNRERALEAERAALRLASEALDDETPSPPETATPIVAPGGPVVVPFAPAAIRELDEPLTTVERASENRVASSERSEADSEAVARSEEPALEIPELTDIVTIGTPWPIPHATDNAQPVEDVPAVVDEAVEDVPAVVDEAVDNETQEIVDELDASEREARAEHQMAPEDALPTDVRDGEAPEASGPVVGPPEERDSVPMADASTEGASHVESMQTLTTPASVESGEASPSGATLAAEPPPSAVPAEKEPWRLWSLFSLGRKPTAEDASVPVERVAVTETDIATVPPASATVALAEVPVESTPSVEAVAKEEAPVESEIAEIADSVPEAATEPSVESAIAGATGISTADAPDDGVLPVPGTPSIEAAGSSLETKTDAFQDNERWEALAEEIRMQVLQRIDIFTDTHLRDQLGVQLQPIVQRASAELVTTINDQVGKLIRAYIAEAIEREIDTWRRNNP